MIMIINRSRVRILASPLSSATLDKFNVPISTYRSFRRQDFPVNHLHWYWWPNKNNQKTEHI